jgi:hypothetical protein
MKGGKELLCDGALSCGEVQRFLVDGWCDFHWRNVSNTWQKHGDEILLSVRGAQPHKPMWLAFLIVHPLFQRLMSNVHTVHTTI